MIPSNTIFFHQRYTMLNKMLALSTLITFVLGVLNLYVGQIQLAILEFTVGILGIVFLRRYKTWITTENIQRFSICFACILLGLIQYAFYIEKTNPLIFIWMFTIPLIAYNTTGVFYGFILTAVFTVCSLGIMFFESNIDFSVFELKQADTLVCLFITWVLTHFHEQMNTLSKKKLTHQATIDPLTGLFNRYALQEIYDRQKLHIISMIILDIDFFKQINDTYGHDAGDFVLKSMGQMLKQSTPTTASVFRLGGEEFGILLPNHTLSAAEELANELLGKIRKTPLKYHEHHIKITASAGIANSKLKRELGDLMKSADQCLYKAKHSGRNNVMAC